MAISKVQPMREAEIDLVDELNQLSSDMGNAEADIETLETGLANESLARESADRLTNLQVSQIDSRLTLVENNVETLLDDVFERGFESETVTADSSATGTIEFQNEKSGIPLVIASLETNDDDASNTGTTFEYFDVSVTGFKYAITNPSVNDSVDVSVNWIAIGE